jgi:hypothetical protein
MEMTMARAYQCDECNQLFTGDKNWQLTHQGSRFKYLFQASYTDVIDDWGSVAFCEDCLKIHLTNFTEEICGYHEEPAALDRELIADVINYLREGEHSTYRSGLRADSLQAMLDKAPEPEHIHNDNVVKAIKKLGNNALWDYADDGKSSVIMSMTLLPETRAEVIKLLEAAEQAGH